MQYISGVFNHLIFEFLFIYIFLVEFNWFVILLVRLRYLNFFSVVVWSKTLLLCYLYYCSICGTLCTLIVDINEFSLYFFKIAF